MGADLCQPMGHWGLPLPLLLVLRAWADLFLLWLSPGPEHHSLGPWEQPPSGLPVCPLDLLPAIVRTAAGAGGTPMAI